MLLGVAREFLGVARELLGVAQLLLGVAYLVLGTTRVTRQCEGSLCITNRFICVRVLQVHGCDQACIQVAYFFECTCVMCAHACAQACSGMSMFTNMQVFVHERA